MTAKVTLNREQSEIKNGIDSASIAFGYPNTGPPRSWATQTREVDNRSTKGRQKKSGGPDRQSRGPHYKTAGAVIIYQSKGAAPRYFYYTTGPQDTQVTPQGDAPRPTGQKGNT